MIRIEGGIEVAAPAERAFAVVARFEEFPDWLPGVQRAERVGRPDAAASSSGAPTANEPSAPAENGPDAPPPVGTEFRLVSSGPGGITVTALGRVEAIDPPRSIAISASSGLFSLAATCTIEPLGQDRSRVTVTADLEPRGLATLASGRIEQELRAATPDALARLRAAVEG